MRKHLIFSAIAALALLACSCQRTTHGEHIYIISTNDIHASIDAIPHLATIIDDYEARGEVIIVDSGDRVTGNAYIDDAMQPGVPLIKLMNAMGFDVATLGNHEFDKGSEVLDTMLAAADFEVVCANVEAHNGATQTKPYTILSRAGIDIGFAGVVATDNNGYPLGGKLSYTNYTFSPDIETAYTTCTTLAAECDFVVLLSHMGAESDRLLTERLAGEALGVDDIWIAGGHSHDTVAEAHDNIHISQNNKNIRYVTVADIEVRDSTIVAIRYEQINTATITPSTTMEQRIEELKASDPELNTVEGFATATATKDGVANFTVEALTSYPYADDFVPEISFYHYGGVRIDAIPAGDVKRVDILNNDPFVSTIYIGMLTPAEMRAFILEKYNSGSPEQPDKESHYLYFRSNVPYSVILGDTPANAPDALDVVFNLEERPYRVAMCNYIAENYIANDVAARALHQTGITVREAMLRLMRSFGAEGFTPDNECKQREIRATESTK